MYLYRTVDSEGNTLVFYLSKIRKYKATKRSFKKALRSFYASKLHAITVDKNPAYPVAITWLQKEKKVPVGIEIRQIKYLTNIVEQDHWFIKKYIRSMLGFESLGIANMYSNRNISDVYDQKKSRLIYRISLCAIKKIYTSFIWINNVKNDFGKNPHCFLIYHLFATES